jgi:hypothetical protein
MRPELTHKAWIPYMNIKSIYQIVYGLVFFRLILKTY